MKAPTLKSDILLLLTATIWGFAFVAQRLGMEHVGPFTFNAIRFALGSLSLTPLLYLNQRQRDASGIPRASLKLVALSGASAGLVLFAGASLQQTGIVYTTAGKAGFITGLYVVLVPILGLCWRQRASLGTWLGAVLAAVGLYLLSITGDFRIAFGDVLVLIGAIFWALHVHIIGWSSLKVGPIRLAFMQFAACSLLSFVAAFFFETISWQGVSQALWPILYGGLLSVGIAYTLQVVAQQDAHPAHAAIILSLEAVFAAVGGWILLGEQLSLRALFGCALMLAGMLLSQFEIGSESLLLRWLSARKQESV